MEPIGPDMKRRLASDADGILKELTTRQYLTPHRPLGQAVAEIVDQLGVCSQAADRAIAWLDLDRTRSIGRLRRGELMQLAHALHRFWIQAIAGGESSTQPDWPGVSPV